ncbi:MAG: alpha/beta hydrolase [Actinomycetales bacterium]|nr:alpha/beta hydrolase [Actinomycetales bacterium]
MKFRRQYIDLRGQKIWASRSKPLFGATESVVILHGGMSQSEGFDNKLAAAVKGFNVHSYDRAGHGRTPDQVGSFHFDFQYKEAVAFLEDVVKEPAHLIGFSDGGIITLMIAINRPDLIKTITLIGANYHHDSGMPPMKPWTPGEAERAKYAALSPDAPETLDKKIKKMVKIWNSEPEMTKKDLKKIKCPALVIAGDDDMASLEHTQEIYESLKDSRLAIIPGASHSIHKDQPELLNEIIRRFLANHEFPVTAQPVRRKKREVL